MVGWHAEISNTNSITMGLTSTKRSFFLTTTLQYLDRIAWQLLEQGSITHHCGVVMHSLLTEP